MSAAVQPARTAHHHTVNAPRNELAILCTLVRQDAGSVALHVCQLGAVGVLDNGHVVVQLRCGAVRM
jgi:hypothetical protein